MVGCLEELNNEGDYKKLNYPVYLCALLLSDWVFTQHHRSMNRAIAIVLEGVSARRGVAHGCSRRMGMGEGIVLPSECGRIELLNHCFDILKKYPAKEYATELLAVIQLNGNKDEIRELWQPVIFNCPKENVYYWLQCGEKLNVLSSLTNSQLDEIISGLPLAVISPIILKSHPSYIEMSKERCDIMVDEILDNTYDSLAFLQQGDTSLIFNFACLTNPLTYGVSHDFVQPQPHRRIFEAIYNVSIESNVPNASTMQNATLAKCAEAIDACKVMLENNSSEWASDLGHWGKISDYIREHWGNRWRYYLFALWSGYVDISSVIECYDLLDESKELCVRVAYAKMADEKWWINQIAIPQNEVEKAFVVSTYLIWANQKAIPGSILAIQQLAESLSPKWWKNISEAITEMDIVEKSQSRCIQLDVGKLPRGISFELAAGLGFRLGIEDKYRICERYLKNYNGNNFLVLGCLVSNAFDIIKTGKYVNQGIEYIRKYYSRIDSYSDLKWFKHPMNIENVKLSCEQAVVITKEPYKYPKWLFAWAERTLQNNLATKIKKVYLIAKRDKWFNTKGSRMKKRTRKSISG